VGKAAGAHAFAQVRDGGGVAEEVLKAHGRSLTGSKPPQRTQIVRRGPRQGARERGSKGTREQGSEGARGRGSEGTRDRGSGASGASSGVGRSIRRGPSAAVFHACRTDGLGNRAESTLRGEDSIQIRAASGLQYGPFRRSNQEHVCNILNLN
jgi:hypothetical protein